LTLLEDEFLNDFHKWLVLLKRGLLVKKLRMKNIILQHHCVGSENMFYHLLDNWTTQVPLDLYSPLRLRQLFEVNGGLLEFNIS
jgi:hypothetical protein